MNFTQALVKTPAQSMVSGITEAGLGKPDFELALVQHQQYIEALQACGVKVTVLPADEGFPDGCFVEDPAIVTPHCAIITRPGAVSRVGETQTIAQALEQHYPKLYHIEAPGTLDGGDVMMVDDHFYIGLSARTNQAGAAQLMAVLEAHQMTASVVELSTVLHLKTGISYLQHNQLLVSGEFINKPEFDGFNRIVVDASESYAANCIWVNETIIMPAGFPRTYQQLKALGMEVILVDVSEYEKLDGGVSCLSLRF